MFPVLCFGQYTSIPDSIFEQELINLGYDTIHDGQVLTADIVNIDSLHLVPPNGGWFPFPAYSSQISDLTGIEDFLGLTYLNCSRNRIVNLDLSQNNALQFLDCSGWYNSMGQFIAGTLLNLDLSQNTALTHLICPFNKLSSLDLSQNTSLTYLDCSFNKFRSIDLSQNITLSYLDCSGTQILNLNLSPNSALTNLNCSGNLITSLDLSQNPSLTPLNCGGGQIYGNPNGKLNTLDLRNGNNNNLISFDATNNPSLHCISVDDSIWSSNNWNNIDNHTIFSNDCNNIQYASPGYTAILDSVFEGKLISMGYDTVPDGKVLTSNIINIDSLDISSNYIFDGIYDLTGLEDFINLTYLDCKRNPVSIIDVSQNTNLTHLIYLGQAGMGGAYSNLLNLVLPQSNNLLHLECPINILSSLDVSQNSSLQFLDCGYNISNFGGLDSVNLMQNQNLEFINLTSTGIKKLDVTTNNSLTKLYCNNIIGALDLSQNTIENLDLTHNYNLDTLVCSGNKLTNLDISESTSLIYLDCKNNLLKNLDLRNGNNVNFTGFDATNNDSLYCISVDDSTWSANNWNNIDNHMIFSNDCNPSSVDIIEIEKSLSVYPNPTIEELNISVENFNGNIKTEVYDLIGNRLQTTDETTISLRDYSKGIYVLKVAYGDIIEEVKVIKY